MSKKKLSFIVIGVILFIILLVFFGMKIFNGTKGEVLKDQTSIQYSDKIKFDIKDKKFSYENKEVGKGIEIAFNKKAKSIAVERDCNPDAKYQLFVLTDDGYLYTNRYPSLKYDDNKKTNLDIEFLSVVTDKKISSLEEVQTEKKDCVSSEVYAVLENNEKHKIKFDYGQTSYSTKSYLLVAAFLEDEVVE